MKHPEGETAEDQQDMGIEVFDDLPADADSDASQDDSQDEGSAHTTDASSDEGEQDADVHIDDAGIATVAIDTVSSDDTTTDGDITEGAVEDAASEDAAQEGDAQEGDAQEGDAPEGDAPEGEGFESDSSETASDAEPSPADDEVDHNADQAGHDDANIDDTAAAVITAPPAAPASAMSSAPFDDSTPLARELAEITRRRQALAASELPLPPAPRIFTVANQKGGVGKTTSTVNLAAALARAGARVLVIDLDPQGNASTALGVEHRSDTISVYDVIVNDEPMSAVVQKSPEFENLYCVPATIHLAGAEIELVSLVAREQRLRTALDKFLDESADDFHYVFIDCPPSLGLLTINAFVAAREVLIPIQCEYYALEGLSQLLNNIALIEKHLNPRLAVSTILLTMYDSRTNLANQVADDVRKHFPKEVLTTLIPRSVRISEAPSYGQSVISYDPTSPGSLSYLEAAAEIARRGAPS